MYKIENELNTRILDSWLESADRWAGPRKFWIFFAQEPPVTWKFDYSSKKITQKYPKFDPKSWYFSFGDFMDLIFSSN